MGGVQVLHISAGLNDLETVRRFVEETARALGVEPSAVYDVLLAVDELTTNMVVHGYRGAGGPIEVRMRAVGDAVEVILRDEAPPFDPTQVPAPDTSSPLEQRPLGGLGIHLARHFMDSIAHRPLPGRGNELLLVKRGVVSGRPKEEPHAPDD